MAQDFRAAFGLGDDDKVIARGRDGVALGRRPGAGRPRSRAAAEIEALKARTVSSPSGWRGWRGSSASRNSVTQRHTRERENFLRVLAGSLLRAGVTLLRLAD
jgi:hypothetical protein